MLNSKIKNNNKISLILSDTNPKRNNHNFNNNNIFNRINNNSTYNKN